MASPQAPDAGAPCQSERGRNGWFAGAWKGGLLTRRGRLKKAARGQEEGAAKGGSWPEGGPRKGTARGLQRGRLKGGSWPGGGCLGRARLRRGR
ncbi:hypothetical protein GCM10020219_090610 [Nonomuraea dietziae]